MQRPFELLLWAIRTGNYKKEVADLLSNKTLYGTFNDTESMLLLGQFLKKEKKKFSQDKLDIFRMIIPRIADSSVQDKSLRQKLNTKLLKFC